MLALATALAAAIVVAASAPADAREKVTVVAAGDIASCDSNGDERTAALVRRLRPDAVLTLGDNAYPDGALDEFRRCYAPTWGAFRKKTRPAPGNHDYATPGAAGYFAYFGARAPRPYYSFDLGGWHLVSLNSEIEHGAGSAQARWLRRDLERSRAACELLYWHRPRWSGGSHGSDDTMHALWRIAYEHGADVVLAGHDHNYQRFFRLGGSGRRNPRHGIVHVVAGTGGRSHYPVGTIPHRAAASATATGVVELTLRRRGFDLRFVSTAPSRYTDALRRQRCHGAPG
jgi:3',5'-cyclic AMP phosphodiesterase CpdA